MTNQDLQTIEQSKVSVTFEPAKLEINNYEAMKQAIENMASFYDNQVITREEKKGAESSRAELINMEKQLEEERKRIKAIYNKPLNEYEAQMKELVSTVQRPLNKIRDGLKEIEQGERDERESILIRYLNEKLEGLDVEIERPDNWLNKGNFTQKGVGSKLVKEIDDAIETTLKEKKQREVNEQVIRSFCETVDVEPEGWLAQLDYKAPTEIMQTIQDKLKADKERLERIEREREELADLEKKNAETLQVDVVEPVKPLAVATNIIEVTGSIEQFEALNKFLVTSGIKVRGLDKEISELREELETLKSMNGNYTGLYALDDLPF